jgi:SAM-dependent methyltransferase
MSSDGRVVWQPHNVVDVRDAVFAARTYLEHRDLRRLLNDTLGGEKLERACEFGVGFGRMVPVLSEFAASVVGFEREPEFVGQARLLFPKLVFQQVDSLERVTAEDNSFDLVLTFTVLQHLIDSVCRSVVAEIRRVLRPGGRLVICEETDPAHISGDILEPNGMCTIGRPVSIYAEWLKPLVLAETRPRIIEPTYPRPDVGTYMLFVKPIG